MTEEKLILVPLGPQCKRCGHSPCPCCGTWCDDLDCVCEDECTYDEFDIEFWLEFITPIVARPPGFYWCQIRETRLRFTIP